MTGGAARPERGVRIGTAERERAAADLGEHFSAGRLTTEEFDERVARAYQARTGADLEPLFTDLPALRAAPPPRARHAVDRRLVLVALLVAACVAWAVFVRVPPFFLLPLIWIFFGARRFGGHRFAHHRF